MSGLAVEGEITSQAIGGTGIHTGAKSFGRAVPFIGGNPYLDAMNNRAVVAMVVIGLIGAYVVYKKVK
ncbi:MAG TPA: hypothetical protein DIW64_16160 [Cellvibrio sp.]|nr:hypothetical protein [Cellvibrio sp.]